MNRRELLKRFGVGAAIVPIIGGVPDIDAKASLIEVPKVELIGAKEVDLAAIWSSPVAWGEFDVTLIARQKSTGETLTMQCSAFLTDMRTERVDVTTHSDTQRKFLPAYKTLTFECSGIPKVTK